MLQVLRQKATSMKQDYTDISTTVSHLKNIVLILSFDEIPSQLVYLHITITLLSLEVLRISLTELKMMELDGPNERLNVIMSATQSMIMLSCTELKIIKVLQLFQNRRTAILIHNFIVNVFHIYRLRRSPNWRILWRSSTHCQKWQWVTLICTISNFFCVKHWYAILFPFRGTSI